ncbi:MAG: hypothetical protein KDA77_06385 [Planctomycetaceae bacterium]|nr:hypothetical protein [Planctomycetaceae bacterium]
MKKTTRTHLDQLASDDGTVQHGAFLSLIKETDKPVEWAYEVWDELVSNLSHKNNRRRAIAAQLLCNLAKSDPKNRMAKTFPALLEVTRDERFVTARHTIQSLWKVGAAGKKQLKLLLEGTQLRFEDCTAEKNCTLIRYDLLQGLRKLYDQLQDQKIKKLALGLIETETDLKYQKKYQTLWKNV